MTNEDIDPEKQSLTSSSTCTDGNTIRSHERALDEASKRFRKVLRNIPLGLAIVDEDLNVQATNQQLQELLGYSADDLADQNLSKLFTDDLREMERSVASKSIAIHREGNEIPVELYVNEVPADEATFLFVHVRDITEAEKLAQLRREFIAMISHDVRSPLSSVHGVISLTRQGTYGELSENGLAAMNRALAGMEYVLDLVENFLDVESIDSGGMKIDPFDTSLTYVVERAVTAVEDLAGQKKVEIETDVEALEFQADEDRLLQVLINLLTNAIKYAPENTPISVSAKIVDEQVRFEIRDQGPGIPESQRKDVFDRFKQVGRDKGRRGGFGLGLTICKEIVNLHGGKIWVEEDQGSTFVFELPLDGPDL